MKRFTLLIVVLLLGGCRPTVPRPVAWQNSTIDALLDGNYDGDVTFAEVRKHGDFGLGTFDALDGEMLMLKGNVYQMLSDGSVYGVEAKQRTPFAVVTFFRPQQRCPVHGPVTYKELQELLDALPDVIRGQGGRPLAIQISGTFDAVRLRSVPRQRKPYPPLAEAAKGQAIFDLKDIDGTLVGFWFPEALDHVNVPGYHFHFISQDGKVGGHVLDLTIRSGVAELQELSAVHVELPRRAPTTRPTTNRADELEAVEK